MKFTDAVSHTGSFKKTDDGYVVQARVARGGNVQEYLGSEMGLPDRPVVRVYRPEDAVFNKDAISSYARKPITIGHPAEDVTQDNWKDLAVGEIDRDVMRDGEFISVPLLFRDAKAVNMIKDGGARELSMGYSSNILFVDGVSPSGDPYDAIMTDFRMNHVAVVDAARGGKELRIGDGANNWGAMPCSPTSNVKDSDMTLLTVVLGDKAAKVDPADAPIIEKFKEDAAKALTDAATASTAALAAKDEEIGTLKAEVKKLTDAAMTPEKMTKMVADRVALEGAVKAIAPKVECADVSDADLRKAAVAAVYGDEMVADTSEAEINGMFKALSKDAASKPKQKDTFADGIRDGLQSPNDPWGSFLPKKEA